MYLCMYIIPPNVLCHRIFVHVRTYDTCTLFSCTCSGLRQHCLRQASACLCCVFPHHMACEPMGPPVCQSMLCSQARYLYIQLAFRRSVCFVAVAVFPPTMFGRHRLLLVLVLYAINRYTSSCACLSDTVSPPQQRRAHKKRLRIYTETRSYAILKKLKKHLFVSVRRVIPPKK